MRTDQTISAKAAEREMVLRILALTGEGKISWTVGELGFQAVFGDDFVAFIVVRGDPMLAEKWGQFTVYHAQNQLVSYHYPESFAEAVGANVAPPEIASQIDQLFHELQSRIVVEKYGPALEKLRTL